MRLIDADALKETLGMKDDCADCDKELRGKSKACEFDRVYTKMDFCGWIDDAPTVYPEPPKMGKWIVRDNPGTGWYRITCSECGEDETSSAPTIGFIPNVRILWNYCPNCGARMEGTDDH